jgi:hypothetical protein
VVGCMNWRHLRIPRVWWQRSDTQAELPLLLTCPGLEQEEVVLVHLKSVANKWQRRGSCSSTDTAGCDALTKSLNFTLELFSGGQAHQLTGSVQSAAGFTSLLVTSGAVHGKSLAEPSLSAWQAGGAPGMWRRLHLALGWKPSMMI